MRNESDLAPTKASTPHAADAFGGRRRRAATEQHLQAIAAINALFDRLDQLSEARDRLTGVSPLGPNDDPIRDAEALLDGAQLLNRALAGLRAAAIDASPHRRRSDLAADIGTKPSLLFARAGRDPNAARPGDDVVKPRDDDAGTGTDAPPSDAR